MRQAGGLRQAERLGLQPGIGVAQNPGAGVRHGRALVGAAPSDVNASHQPGGVSPSGIREIAMRFGLFGSAQARRGGPDVDSGQGFRDFIDYNVEAEALGFYSTFLVEHHFTGFGQVSASLNLLTWLGARTRTLRLGTAVIVLPWHNPVLLAEQAATLDLLSGGRLDFGVGRGYRHNEFQGFCIPMEEGSARFEEAIDIITKSWVSNERFSFEGKFWQYDD